MDNTARRKLTIKMVFGIAIPLLIMVVTLVMVGASFAWFSDAKEVTISTITMETAQAYRVDFSLDKNDLFDNMKYAGQEELSKRKARSPQSQKTAVSSRKQRASTIPAMKAIVRSVSST